MNPSYQKEMLQKLKSTLSSLKGKHDGYEAYNASCGYSCVRYLNPVQSSIAGIVTTELRRLTPERKATLTQIIESSRAKATEEMKNYFQGGEKEKLSDDDYALTPEKMVDFYFQQMNRRPGTKLIMEKGSKNIDLGSRTLLLFFSTKYPYFNYFKGRFETNLEYPPITSGKESSLVPAIIPYDAIKNSLNKTIFDGSDTEITSIESEFVVCDEGQGGCETIPNLVCIRFEFDKKPSPQKDKLLRFTRKLEIKVG